MPLLRLCVFSYTASSLIDKVLMCCDVIEVIVGGCHGDVLGSAGLFGLVFSASLCGS